MKLISLIPKVVECLRSVMKEKKKKKLWLQFYNAYNILNQDLNLGTRFLDGKDKLVSV
jgi:hypothetical protein